MEERVQWSTYIKAKKVKVVICNTTDLGIIIAKVWALVVLSFILTKLPHLVCRDQRAGEALLWSL